MVGRGLPESGDQLSGCLRPIRGHLAVVVRPCATCPGQGLGWLNKRAADVPLLISAASVREMAESADRRSRAASSTPDCVRPSL